ncbi:hypothetical protein MMC30_006341 [Trapelia coarctata]|nr:hypothetical protein [Trapelia coarctata]
MDVTAFDIDLVANEVSTIRELHGKGRKVICYFSAGSFEDFRPDSKDFQASDYGNPLDGWPDEWWLNTKSANVRKIMIARMELAKSKGCDAVDPDNVDGFTNDTGFTLTKADAVDYLEFLAEAAHSRGMAIGLKNAGDIISELVDHMEFAVNEVCNKYDECEATPPRSSLLGNPCSTSNTPTVPQMWTSRPRPRSAMTQLPRDFRLRRRTWIWMSGMMLALHRDLITLSVVLDTSGARRPTGYVLLAHVRFQGSGTRQRGWCTYLYFSEGHVHTGENCYPYILHINLFLFINE